MNVILSSEESEALRKALRTYVSDLRMEIVDTDNPAYKHELQSERNLLNGALEKIDAGHTESHSAATNDDATTVIVSIVWADEVSLP